MFWSYPYVPSMSSFTVGVFVLLYKNCDFSVCVEVFLPVVHSVQALLFLAYSL